MKILSILIFGHYLMGAEQELDFLSLKGNSFSNSMIIDMIDEENI